MHEEKAKQGGCSSLVIFIIIICFLCCLIYLGGSSAYKSSLEFNSNNLNWGAFSFFLIRNFIYYPIVIFVISLSSSLSYIILKSTREIEEEITKRMFTSIYLIYFFWVLFNNCCLLYGTFYRLFGSCCIVTVGSNSSFYSIIKSCSICNFCDFTLLTNRELLSAIADYDVIEFIVYAILIPGLIGIIIYCLIYVCQICRTIYKIAIDYVEMYIDYVKYIIIYIVSRFFIDDSIQIVSSTHKDWSKIANEIANRNGTIYDKAHSVYQWLVNEVKYDRAYNTADDSYDNKKGVCKAYSELFYRIGTNLDIDVRVLSGYVKKPNGQVFVGTTHAWTIIDRYNPLTTNPYFNGYIYASDSKKNSYELRRKYCVTKGINVDSALLIDSTWAAEYTIGNKFIKRQDDNWFDVNPYWMIFSHFPYNGEDQLLPPEEQITFKEFKKMPRPSQVFLEYHVNAKFMFNNIRKRKLKKLAEVFSGAGDYVELLEFPVERCLSYKKKYEIKIRKIQSCKLIIFNAGYEEVNWDENNGICRIQFCPHKKWFNKSVELKIYKSNTSCASGDNDNEECLTILKYNIQML